MVIVNQDSMERSSSELGTADQFEGQDAERSHSVRPMAESELRGDASNFESVLQSEVSHQLKNLFQPNLFRADWCEHFARASQTEHCIRSGSYQLRLLQRPSNH